MTDALPSPAGGANDGIVLLVTNEFLDDPRVFRAATALAEHGHRTSVVCFVDNATHPAVEEHRGVRVLRIARSSSLIGGLRGRFGRPGAIAPSAPTSESSPDVADSPRCSEPDRRVSLRERLIESGIFLNNDLRWFVKVLGLSHRRVCKRPRHPAGWGASRPDQAGSAHLRLARALCGDVGSPAPLLQAHAHPTRVAPHRASELGGHREPVHCRRVV